MKNFYLLAFLLLASLGLGAQAEVTGTIVDSTGTGLPGANAVLLRQSDSLLTAFGTADVDGKFRMENVKPGSYLMRVTFLGYERPDQPLTVGPDDQYLGLGEIKMYPAGFLLSGIEVTGDRIPIRMKGDTMMYDAAAFGVSENAVVEDLLRRLPGMTVDAGGNITWQGKPISEVMVNGKPFFAGNTTLLTQNLDAKAVKSVQVFDQRSDNEEVTGIDDGEENITVNLETKEEFKAKVFGDVYAGYGTQDRYQAGGKAFRIADVAQWGVLGTVNNINKVGFSGDEISGFNGSSGRGRGAWWSSNNGSQSQGLQRDNGNATGDNRSIAAGLNFGRTIGEGGQLTADYALFDRTQTQLTGVLQSFTGGRNPRVVETDEVNAAQSYRHSFGAEFRQKIDSVGRIRVNANFNLDGGDNQDFSNTLIKASDGSELDAYTVNNLSAVDQPNGSFRATYTTALNRRDRGRNFNIGFNGSFRENQRDIDLTTDGLNEGLELPGALVNGFQNQNRLTDQLDLGVNAGFNEPLGEKWRLELKGGANYDRESGDYRFNFNESTTTNNLQREWTTFTPGAGLVRELGRGSNFSFGTEYQISELKVTGDEERTDTYGNFNPYARLRLRMEKGFFGVFLNSSVRAPNVGQLQTIAEPNVNGRLNIGNPDLTPTQNTNFSTYLWYNDQFRAISGNFNVYGGYNDNAFGNSVTFTEGQQIFQTVNVSHAWNGGGNLGATIGINKIDGELRLSANSNYSIGQGFVDGESRTNTNLNNSVGASLNTEINEDSYVTVGYTFNDFRNSFDDDTPATTQQSHNLNADFALELNPTWRFETRFLYSIFPESDFAPRQTIPDLRAQLEVRPFKKAGHYFRLSASDIFNQNTIVNRNVSAFVTTETTATGLGFYFLTTFFYKL